MMRLNNQFSILLLSLIVLCPAAWAQNYPTKPIRLLVPIPAGGGPDIVGRLVAARLSESLGQQVVVENRVGANGTVAGEAVVKSAPDGYTLLVGMDSLLTINPHLYSKMPFDPLQDLTPVASLVSNGFFLAINPHVPAASLPEFIEYARQANPPLQYASGGNGSQHHLTMERLKARAGVNLLHVPYKGGTPATIATLQGEVSAMMSGTSTAVQIRAGKLRAIAYTGPKRSAILPDVPAVAEYYPDFEMTQWYGLFAPPRTPETVLARLRVEVTRALRAPDMADKLKAAGGVEAWITTPEEFVAAIRADHAKNGKLVRETGVKLD